VFDVEQISQLLARDQDCAPTTGAGLENQVICATGAGGSSGSHLLAKIAGGGKSARLVLLDNNEYRLYEVNRPLQSIAAQVVPVLLDYGSPNVFRLLPTLGGGQGVPRRRYKHIPLVERNPVAAMANNVLATQRLFGACAATNIRSLTVVSTGKAVRPTLSAGMAVGARRKSASRGCRFRARYRCGPECR
jgi:FlaA1/EpsC-like NDP-sugar epimerase